MEFYVGKVVSNVDVNKSGEFMVSFPKYARYVPQPVTYTSPYCTANAGGFIAIPNVDDEIIALYNEDPAQGESVLYYHSTVIRESDTTGDKEFSKEFKAVRSNDPKAQIYGESDQPVTQTFTNTAGAGLYIQREFTSSKISNNVTLKSESGEEVNVGSIGVQIRNADGDSIVLNGAEPNDAYAARSLMVNTRGPQEYKCNAADINMKIVDGGDINIENNSTGVFSLGKWFGNIRLKSRFRNIELVACGPTGAVNIITPGATIQVDGTGAVKILAAGNIDFNSAGSINMNAALGVNIYGGPGLGPIPGGVNLNSANRITNTAPIIQDNGVPMSFTAGPPGLDYTQSIPIPSLPGIPNIPPIITPNDYADPVGAV